MPIQGPIQQADTSVPAHHRLWPAIRNGLLCRCPKCGQGKLYDGFLEQVEHCAVCGEPLARFNVGLLLPFVMIMIVAHVLIFVMLELEMTGLSSPLLYLVVMVPLSLIVPLATIRPLKGGLIGLLWARSLSDEQER